MLATVHNRTRAGGLGALALCLVALMVAPAPAAADPPASITLTGTIRDFQASHPDFEDFIGDDRGIVSPTLGVDAKPVYANPTGTTPTTTGQANFDQWYRDVPGVNQTTPHDIQLDLVPASSPPRYRFSSSSFFPIDGQLWGNEGQAHNYWFTYEVHNTFTYEGGETLSFTGDDDVWVFVNGRLIVDLGGVHMAESATVDLDAIASAIGIAPGNSYSFDAFFAERHTTQSNFTMETSIQLDPELSIADRTVNELSSGGRSAGARASDPPARFVVSLTAPSGDPVKVDYTTVDGDATAPGDYATTAGQLRFAPGKTSKKIEVPIVPDNSDEFNETFTVELSNPHGAQIDDGTATGTIKDDDGGPLILLFYSPETEGATQRVRAELYPAPSSRKIRLDYQTSDGEAVAPDDYASTSGTLNFQPGDTEKTLRVPTVQDDAQENDETFTFTFSNPVNASLIDDPTIFSGTILDDDPD